MENKHNFKNRLAEKKFKAIKGIYFSHNPSDNSSNATFSQIIESVQYNATLAITGAIHGSSGEKLYQEL